jgi:hypothetical protein
MNNSEINSYINVYREEAYKYFEYMYYNNCNDSINTITYSDFKDNEELFKISEDGNNYIVHNKVMYSHKDKLIELIKHERITDYEDIVRQYIESNNLELVEFKIITNDYLTSENSKCVQIVVRTLDGTDVKYEYSFTKKLS